MTKVRRLNGYLMGDFNMDLLAKREGGAAPDLLGECLSSGFYPLVSLPTRITDTSATLIDNIWTNDLTKRVVSGLVTVRLSDHLPIFAFIGGSRDIGPGAGKTANKRLVNEGRITRFAEELEGWCFDVQHSLGAEGNIAQFRNSFSDMYNLAFPLVKKN